MRTIPILLAFIAISLSFTSLFVKKHEEISNLKIENTELSDALVSTMNMLDESEKDLKILSKEYESLPTNYTTLKGELDKATTVATPSVEQDPRPPVVTREPADTTPTETRLATLKGIYETAKAELDRKKATLDANLRNARITYEQLLDNPPSFKEQGERRSTTGALLGNKGVRTSDADRARANEKHNAELLQWKTYIATSEAALKQLNTESKTLEDSYRKAVTEAKNLK